MNAVGNIAISAGQIALLQKAFIKSTRSLGDVIPGIVIRESHRDQLKITDHPIDRGAVISDHAIKQPAEVTVECGWSNSPPTQGYLSVTPAAQTKSITEVYQRLLKMQNDLELVDVLTGKRSYSNMMLVEIDTETDVLTENVLIARATFREVRIVGVQVLDLNSAQDTSKQRDPAITAPTVNAGTKQLGPAPLYNPQAGP